MILDPDDAERVIRLHQALMLFVNDRLKLTKPPRGASKSKIVPLPQSARLDVRNALAEHRDLIAAFADANPYAFDVDDLEIVRSWEHFVWGDFFVLKFLRTHTVFVSATDPPVVYGVLGVVEPLDVVIQEPLPFYGQTMLLPYRDRITYDGLLGGYNIDFGRNITRELNDTYRQAKALGQVVTRLPWAPEAATPKPRSRRPKPRKPTPKAELLGRWRITWMENWDQDFVDAEVEGYIEFGDNRQGAFQFGYVHGWIDHRPAERDGRPAVEFSWEGNDEMDPATGRGWAAPDGDELEGQIVFHGGDESDFRAVRKAPGAKPKRRGRPKRS